MNRTDRKLTKEQQRQIAAKKDADIDLTEMPEVRDWSKAEAGKFFQRRAQPEPDSER